MGGRLFLVFFLLTQQETPQRPRTSIIRRFPQGVAIHNISHVPSLPTIVS